MRKERETFPAGAASIGEEAVARRKNRDQGMIVRIATAILFGLSCLASGTVRADNVMTPVNFDSGVGYIVSPEYAAAHKQDFLTDMLEYHKDVDFWMPTADDVIVAERAFRQWIQDGSKDAGAVFPDMDRYPESFPPGEVEFERLELGLINQNYASYARQYVGLVVHGRKVILCNYYSNLEADPAVGFVFMRKVFVEDRGIHFVQGWFDPDTRLCSNIVIVGLWQKLPDKF
jgi:hypothetical protein